MEEEKNLGGRPVIWTPDKIVEAKQLYLALLKEGKTEYQINACEGLPSHPYRNEWLDDEEFAEQVKKARAIGATMILENYERDVELVYQMAIDEAASPQLVSVVKEKGTHARWKASKYNRQLYGDKNVTELQGSAENPVSVQVIKKIELVCVRPKDRDS